MATFVAQVRDARGEISRQKLQAATMRDARTALRDQGFFIQQIQPYQGFDLAKLQSLDIGELTARVTVKDKAVFSRQLSVLVNAGVPIVRALGMLSDQAKNPKLKQALVRMSQDVQGGGTLSDSMRHFPDVFDSLYIAMIQAGEVGGVLDDVLERLSKLLEDMARLQNQIKSAMSYPLTVGFIAVAVFLGMTIFLIPIFANIYKGLGAELPAFTQAMLMISAFLRTPAYSVTGVLILIAAGVAFQNYYRTPIGRISVDRNTLRLPVLGDLIQKTATARFCRTFGSLTKAGVPILSALDIVRDTAGNAAIAQAIDAAKREVQSGGQISTALSARKIFPIMALSMISIGEETGELDAMVTKVADFYEDEVEQAVKGLTSMLEPVMILLIGGIVGSILMSMYLPMFSIFDKLK